MKKSPKNWKPVKKARFAICTSRYAYGITKIMKSKRSGCLYLFLGFILVGIIMVSTNNINGIGLSVLTTWKKLTNENVAFHSLKGVAKPVSHSLWNKLLKDNVSPSGQVNYQGFEQKRDTVKQYLDLLSDNPPDSEKWSKNEKLAYWINAYNAFTVELILAHYPVGSIKKIGGNIPMVNSPWDIKFFRIGDLTFDLNTIEHEILRKEFDEPRIHFAINCASVSCPILINEAYLAESLETQLQQRAIQFINNPKKNIIKENELQLSPIFNWFESDFTKNGTLITFINQYRNSKVKADTELEFLPYNWNLNE